MTVIRSPCLGVTKGWLVSVRCVSTPPPDGRRARTQRSGDRYPTAVLLVALSGLFATTFPVTVLTLALPSMADDFGVSDAAMAWVVTLPMIASALALPVLGKLGDLKGHRRVFVAGFALATVLTALSATATSAPQLIGWRTLAQVAGTATMPSSLALINSVHQGSRRARAMGWWSMTSAGAPVVGLSVGAPVIDAFGWPTLFLVQAGLMVVPVIASWRVLRETPIREARFDLPGAASLAVGVGPLLLVANQVADWGVTELRTLVCVALSVVGLRTFWGVERRSPSPLVPPSFLRSRPIVSVYLVSLFSGASYMGGFFLASLLLVQQFDYSLTSAVPILSIRPVLFAAFSPVGGALTNRFGSRLATTVGCTSLAGGLGGLALGSAVDSLLVVVLVGFIFQGIGYGLLRPASTTALANAVVERDLGVAGATERLVGQVGVVFGITIMAAVYGGDVGRFPPAFTLGAAAAVLAALAARGLVGRRVEARADAPADVFTEEDARPPEPAGEGAACCATDR